MNLKIFVYFSKIFNLNFCSDFCQSKAMHVRAKLRQFLREDEVEKPAETKNWFLIRSEQDIQLATQEILENF